MAVGFCGHATAALVISVTVPSLLAWVSGMICTEEAYGAFSKCVVPLGGRGVGEGKHMFITWLESRS